MSPRAYAIAGALLLTGLAGPAEAASQLRFATEAFVGGAVNAPSSLTLHQDGELDIEMTARYDTRSFREPVYWSVRLSLLDDRRSFELQLTHHKLHLSNPSTEVQGFQITHGFNILTLGYGFRGLPVEIRAGGGVVLAHPEGTVRGRRFDSAGRFAGHTLSGPVLTGGVGKRFELVPHLLFTVASDVTVARANGLKVGGGSVDASNFALHLRLGLGYAF